MQDDSVSQKKLIRNQTSAFRRSLDEPTRSAASHNIARLCVTAVSLRGVTSIALYNAIAALGEVDTLFLRSRLKEAAPHLHIDMVGNTPSAPLPTKQYDLIIVPVVAFDEHLNRVGMGGGWYDKFLAAQPGARKVGLAYEAAKAPQIPAESHDIPLDLVVTERAVYAASGRETPSGSAGVPSAGQHLAQ